MFLKTFKWSLITTLIALTIAFIYGSWEALILCLILAALEISLSFDNAVVNARVLRNLNAFWQKIFLTVGILIAVVGMRVIFPFAIVSLTANLSPKEAVRLALEKGDPDVPGTYGYVLHQAHPQIAAFGGMFLLLLFINFFLEKRDTTWIKIIENPLQKLHKVPAIATIFSLAVLGVTLYFNSSNRITILVSGLLGVGTYLIVDSLGKFFYKKNQKMLQSSSAQNIKASGKAAFFMFLYLEVLDASFSFDGVLGAFAITSDPIIIMLGLGLIGSIYVRSITIYLVKHDTIARYKYLEHGAHWAIGSLATILIVSIKIPVNELITGISGMVFIAAAIIHSIKANKILK